MNYYFEGEIELEQAVNFLLTETFREGVYFHYNWIVWYGSLVLPIEVLINTFNIKTADKTEDQIRAGIPLKFYGYKNAVKVAKLVQEYH